jgi:WD40 repeat protein
MDNLNTEGLIGTVLGSIYYVSFTDNLIIRLVSKPSAIQDGLPIVKFNLAKPNLFLTSNGDNSSTVKLWATSTVDQVMQFKGHSESPVKFILSNLQNSKFTLVGYADGVIKSLSIETLKVEA